MLMEIGKACYFIIYCSQVDRCRLEIGHFELETVGDIISGEMRINLFDANITGTLETTEGKVSFTTLTFSSEHMFMIDISTTGREAGLDLRYIAEQGICDGRYLPDNYVKNPVPECTTAITRAREYQVCQHRLLAGGDYAEAYHIERNGNQILMFATVDNAIPANQLRPVPAKEFSVSNLERMMSRNIAELLDEHYTFWHAFYKKSFLSIPDMKWEGFYWIQVVCSLC